MLNNLSWNVFRQTGDIETYLLMKELESQDQQSQAQHASSSDVEKAKFEDLNL
ncbi:YqzL family protein [Halobacillus locisalis]|uniref:YqzL family protein n=1 Tax=Halobacillus locisalis TaxID=220753 RepID=A0A838CNF8_9BACI|nr:YqzL family protein [Halobacillus locisalis]